MRKICWKIHRWLSIPLGVFMSILCFTGLILLFGKEIASAFGQDSRQMPFLVAIRQLHRWLLMVPDNPHGGLSLGRIITAVSAMAMTLVLLTGVVIWWPKNKEMLKNRLTVSTSKGFRRFVHDTHVTLGIYAFVFLFLMAVTGPVFSFGWYNQGLSKLLGQKTMDKEMMAQKGSDREAATKAQAWDKRADKQMGKPTESQQNGSLMKGGPHGKKSHGAMLFKSLHMGTWGGWFSKILYALAALIGGFLPISGYYLWWKRKHRAA